MKVLLSFCDTTLCLLLEILENFGDLCASCFKYPYVYSSTCQYPQQILPKCGYLSINTHGVLSHKTVNFIVTVVSHLYILYILISCTNSGILTLWKSKWIWTVIIQFLPPPPLPTKNIFSSIIKTNFKKCLGEIVTPCFGKLRKHVNNSAVFEGVLADLRKVTFGSIIYSLSVCTFFCMKQLGWH